MRPAGGAGDAGRRFEAAFAALQKEEQLRAAVALKDALTAARNDAFCNGDGLTLIPVMQHIPAGKCRRPDRAGYAGFSLAWSDGTDTPGISGANDKPKVSPGKSRITPIFISQLN
ncbi:MAG: hypothetical protein JWM59_2925 [Verrucomicrobiales bacterium]|nr:hypothetical protein [Verrucomicrobiales bacterium]